MSETSDRAFWLGRPGFPGKPAGLYGRSDDDFEDSRFVYDDGLRLAAPPSKLSAARSTVLVIAGFLVGIGASVVAIGAVDCTGHSDLLISQPTLEPAR